MKPYDYIQLEQHRKYKKSIIRNYWVPKDDTDVVNKNDQSIIK